MLLLLLLFISLVILFFSYLNNIEFWIETNKIKTVIYTVYGQIMRCKISHPIVCDNDLLYWIELKALGVDTK